PSMAMAADLDPIDVFVGDFAGVVSLDFDKLVTNKLIDDLITKNAAPAGGSDIINEFKAAGLDYKKDIDTVTIAVNEKGHVCAVVDGKKSLQGALDYEAKKNNYTASDYNGVSIVTDGANSFVLLNEKRLLGCEKQFDVKAMIDNAKAEKPKLLKDRDATIYKSFHQADKKAEIRFGGKMTKHLKDRSQSYKLNNAENKSIAVNDIDSGSVSISLSKGLEVSMIAVAKSDETAALGASIINENLANYLPEDMLKEMNIGFVKKAISVVADKKNVNAKIKFNEEEKAKLAALVMDLTAGALPQQQPKKAAGPKAAPTAGK
ncbi:MAG: hypothetical protein J6A01_07665, partial [Proteobacteria bacterium]|nr:hypothetical protein [Pseudomonadota bacterium]